jgi:hypothetical protein
MGEYNKVPPQEHEMASYSIGKPEEPVVAMKPVKDFEDGRKEQRKSAKEVRISVSILILTFLASACIVFGTLFPELSRGEVDMRPFRDAMYAIKRMSPHLVKDRITLVNLGLWRYCYDDQLYDLIEIINPGGFSGYKKKRDVSENSEELDIVKRETEHSIVKRQKTREGDLAIRCHPVPAPWKMPYHVKYKQEIVKVTLLIGIVACVISFLVSILVLITRLPLLKIFLVFVCLCAAVSIGTALGVAMTMADDAEKYFNEAIGRKTEKQISEELGISLRSMGINLEGMNLIQMAPGVSSVFIAVACIFMLLSVVLAEINRQT